MQHCCASHIALWEWNLGIAHNTYMSNRGAPTGRALQPLRAVNEAVMWAARKMRWLEGESCWADVFCNTDRENAWQPGSCESGN